MKQIPTKSIPPESSLLVVPAAQVAHLRALNTSGESVNVTPATLREMTGNRQEINFQRTDLLNTSQFVELLSSLGAFKNGYWAAKVKFSYSENPRVQTHSVGVISLAGAVIECFGTSKCYNIRITTASTAADATDMTNCVAVYTDNSGYGPGWRIASAGGIDYSKLEEQIVPGEFWVDANGDKRQVYCRRFRIEIPSLASRVSYGQIPMQGFSTILQTSGTWLIYTTSFAIGQVNCNIDGTIRDLFRINTDGGGLWYQLIGTVGAPVKIDLLVSYTK